MDYVILMKKKNDRFLDSVTSLQSRQRGRDPWRDLLKFMGLIVFDAVKNTNNKKYK